MQSGRFISVLTALLLLVSSPDLAARGFRFGVEWGISPQLYSNTEARFIADDGYLVDYHRESIGFHVNGSIAGFVGYDVARRLCLSIHSGYMGLTEGNNRGVPLTLRLTSYLSENPGITGSSLFVEGGAFFRSDVPVSGLGKMAYSYRFNLAPFLFLDFNAGAQFSFSHPSVYDKYAGQTIEYDRIAFMRNVNVGLLFSIALLF
ncbi:MAG: hypothetical protein ACI3ZO_01065 [Candidatus Cryptobacteroides sp.]|nr:hypothetical protein [Bacteroidales bacterium]